VCAAVEVADRSEAELSPQDGVLRLFELIVLVGLGWDLVNSHWRSSQVVGNSPDNLSHNAQVLDACRAESHNAYAVGTPKMPGEPPRVQPSKINPLNWENTPHWPT